MTKIRNLARVVGRDIAGAASKTLTPLLYPVLGNLPIKIREGLESLLPDFDSEATAGTSLATNFLTYGIGGYFLSQYLSANGYLDNLLHPELTGLAGVGIGVVAGFYETMSRLCLRESSEKRIPGSVIGTLASLPISLPVQYARSVYRRAKEREREEIK